MSMVMYWVSMEDLVELVSFIVRASVSLYLGNLRRFTIRLLMNMEVAPVLIRANNLDVYA